MSSMQIIVDGLSTRYDLKGKGPLVLLLHGWGDTRNGLKLIAQHLSENFTVLSLDLPGFGDTEPPKSVWNLDHYAEFIAHTLKKLSFDQPYALIGHSNGGAIAIRGIANKIILPKKLILIASAGIRPSKTTKRLMYTMLAKSGNVATLWMPQRYRLALRQSLYQAAGSDMLVVPELEETFKKTVREDVQSDAQQIKIPTLLIFADNDDAIPHGSGSRFHTLISKSKLEQIADAGHFVHIDQPEKVNQLIQEFLV